jgi:hypothetical protein
MSRSRASAKPFGELYVRPVATPDGESLGWAVCVLIKEPSPGAPIGQDSATGQRADLLTIKQRRHKWEALCAEQGLQDFLVSDRQLIADLASPRELWEWIAEPQMDSDHVYWTELEGEELADFRTGREPIVCTKEDWHPQQDPLTEVFDGHPEFAYLASKLRRLLNALTIEAQ